ncbi:MAG: DUF4339 domain-containing protein [Paramuribaculum sp.]|nr:DUF4339 domain-containing protein [Paramuribaculum sp.]
MYYIIYKGTAVGPMSKEEMAAYHVTPDTLVARAGGNDWQPLYKFPELMQYVHVNQPGAQKIAVEASNRVVCGVCAMLIGWIGLQYFLIGKGTAGVLTIILSFVTLGIWQIVSFIQGICMLCMSDAEFDQKYVSTADTFPLF